MPAGTPRPRSGLAIVVLVLIIVGYPVAFETLTRGRSLGKLALGLRVVRDDGGAARFRQALIRGLFEVVEIWILLGVPAIICSLLNSRGKRIGDLAAGTVVVRERTPKPRSSPERYLNPQTLGLGRLGRPVPGGRRPRPGDPPVPGAGPRPCAPRPGRCSAISWPATSAAA